MYDEVTLQRRFVDNIKQDYKHKYYDHVNAKARLYRQWITGEDQTELIAFIEDRETKNQKEYRAKVTNTRTKFCSSQVMTVFDEVKRADNAVQNIVYDSNISSAAENIMQLTKVLEDFTLNNDLKGYLHQKLKHLNFIDPNAFLIFEFKRYDDQVHVYPIIAYSDQVIDYEFDHNVLQYLQIRHETYKINTSNGKRVKEKAKIDYFYSRDVSYTMRELGEVGKYEMPVDLQSLSEDDYQILVFEKDKKEVAYMLRTFVHSSGVTPALQVGYIPDETTEQKTFVSILDPAEHIFADLINTKSEYDLSKALHGFYKKYAYANDCDYRMQIDGRFFACKDGLINGKECPNCGGEGLVLHSSVQDVILVQKPQDKETHIPLSDFVHYVQIPDNIIQNQKEELEKLEGKIVEAIFNHIPFDKSQVATTATEKRIMREGVYNKFEEFGANYSRIFKQSVQLVATHLTIEEGLQVSHQFKKDWHLESVTELIELRKQAEDSNLPYSIVQQIDFQILSKQSQDNPSLIKWEKAKAKFLPMKGKTESEKMTVINTLPDLAPTKILYLFFDEIFEEIKNSQDPNINKFPEYPHERQRQIIDEMIRLMIDRNNITQAVTAFNEEI